MDTVFTVTANHLFNLGPQDAVNVVRQLLWAEATAIGLPRSQINVPFNINAADGGIDAEVTLPPGPTSKGLLIQGTCKYQIKSGPIPRLTDKVLRDLLYEKRTKELKGGVRHCFEQGGTFVALLFGWDNPRHNLEDKISKMTEIIEKQYPDLGRVKITVWGQNKIASLVSVYPSISLAITSRGGLMQTHKRWSANANMSYTYFPTSNIDSIIKTIIDELLSTSQNNRIHVFGDSGVGKTRIVLEATRDERIQPLILYFSNPGDLRNSDLYRELAKGDNPFRCILIVDECSPEKGYELTNFLGPNRQGIRLITINDERVSRISGTVNIGVPRLPREQSMAIISSYGIESVDASRWADFVDGFARDAHDVGQHLVGEEPNLLKSPDMIRVWQSRISINCTPGSNEHSRRVLVLRCLSLYRQFGFDSDHYRRHRNVICSKVQEIDSTISKPQFESIIVSLRDIGILRGEYVLRFTRKLMHLRMWVEWWEHYGGTYNYSRFVEGVPDDLIGWHNEMFTYAAESPTAEKITRDLLGPDGAFPTGESLNSMLSSRLFFALTNADSTAACAALERAIGSWNEDQLRHFEDGRRYVVWALERIVIWKETFERGARLLLALARAETEDVANNATGVFAELFAPGFGRLAPTEVPPMKRITLLQELFDSGNHVNIRIALLACDKALGTQGGFREVGPEYQGLKKLPELWTPKTWGELYEYYETVWNLVSAHYATLDTENAKKGIEILLNRARGLAQIQYLAPIVQKTMENLASSYMVDKEEVVKVILRILHYDRNMAPPDIVAKWEEIQKDIVGSDFSSLLKRYVGMFIYEDHIDDKGNKTDVARARIGTLAEKVAAEPALLNSELTWLMTEKAARGVEFGFDLGSIDTVNSFLPLLIESQKRGDNRAFLGGYFAALLHRDESLWETTLEEIANDDETVGWVPELTWRSGITDRAAKRILELAEAAKIRPEDLEPFSRGGIARKIAESILIGWLRFLLSPGNRKSIAIAMQLHHYYYAYPEPVRTMPRDITLELILHDSLFDLDQRDEWIAPIVDGIWEWTALALLYQNPDIGLEIAKKYIVNFGLEGTIIGGYHSGSQRVMNAIAERFPSAVWQLAVREIGPPVTAVAFHISQWLRGGEFSPAPQGAMYFFDRTDIWRWVDANKNERAPYMAYIVPPSLSNQGGVTSLARDVLVRYGGIEAVRNEFHANYGTEGFTGPGSLHFRKKKAALEQLRSIEQDANVLQWLDEEIKSVEYIIEREKIEEEHRGF
ncbi:MAG: hypothetical protein NT002_00420 [candidate division Zixibacteria bacterium]|nr:hypothetical protein [candidate division Zixibacteria bacterium]